MAVPKRKKSRSKVGMRRGSHRKAKTAVQKCPQCGGDAQPHRVCSSCGYYRGRQVLTVHAAD